MTSSIVNNSFYLSSIYSDLKSSNGWTTHEIKLSLLLFSKLDKYRIWLPDFDNFDNDIEEFNKKVSNIPDTYVITKKEFQDVTGVRNEHLSREINKTRKLLGSKIINTPHHLDNNPDSGITIPWFSSIGYLSKIGEIRIVLNKPAIERLVALVKYSNISFQYIVKMQNHNAIYIYLVIKILKDSSNQNKLNLTINNFKEKLGLLNKYSEINLFRKYVLDVVKKEIYLHTDMDFDYKLRKAEAGKAFKYIDMNFAYKQGKSASKNSEKKLPKKIEAIESPFYQILVGWNIRARKVIELEEIYSLDVIQSAINLTLEKEKAGEIKTTKAAIFLGILENKQLASDEQFEKAKNELENQQDKKLREKISAEYDKLSSFILSNQDIIQSALTANTKQLPTTDKDAIPIFKKLKSINADKFRAYTVPILSFYHFESNSNVSSILSDIVDRSHYIEIEEYKDDMEIVQAYKKAFEKIKENEYISSQQKELLKKEVLESINILLGF